jgi:hypothetical protein
MPAGSVLPDPEAGGMTLRIDPTVLDDHARLADDLLEKQAAVEEAERRGDRRALADARASLLYFSVLFCEEVA